MYFILLLLVRHLPASLASAATSCLDAFLVASCRHRPSSFVAVVAFTSSSAEPSFTTTSSSAITPSSTAISFIELASFID